MRYIIVMILVWLFIKQTSAQSNGTISVTLQSEMPAQNEYAVILKSGTDSSVVKIETNRIGQTIEYKHIAYGTYFIEVSYMQNVVGRSGSIDLHQPNYSAGVVDVRQEAHKMKEVKIVQRKNIVERKTDKLIFNVEATQTATADDALGVLQKAPGIAVDQNGQISMRGKSGVLVMINGKQTYVQGDQLRNLLSSTMANQIARIEIISNPSSKYDANGNTGIVNIILKKDMRKGTNGTATLSYGRGFYRKSNNSVSLNHRTGKINIFGSYNFVANTGFNDLRLYRKFYDKGQYQGAYQQNNYIIFPFYNHLAKVGVDFTPSAKTTVGFLASGNINSFKPHGDNKTYVENAASVKESYYTTANRSDDFWYNGSANLNVKHQFDSSGRELTLDADYARYGNRTTQHFTTRYFDLYDQENKNAYVLLGKINGLLDIKACKADYVHPLKNNAKLEAGWKSSFVKADNNLAFYNESSGIPVMDTLQSNHFIYHENINALYAILSGERKSLSVQFGLRAEQTVAKGEQLTNHINFKRNYWQLFPSLFISKKINDQHDAGVSFSRRIQRPTYEQLNPFKFFLDPSTYKEGNPYLTPQNAYIFELTHTFKGKIVTTLSSNITNKSITEVLIPAEGQSNITIQTNKNLNKQVVHSLGLSVPVQVCKWWTAMSDASVYYSAYTGQLAGQSIQTATVSFNAKTMHTFILPKQFTLQLDGFMQYAERYSFSTLSTFGAVNFSLQKSAWQKRATVKLSANDLFYTARFRGSSHFNNYHEDFYVQRDSRNFVVAFSYRFGNNTIAPSRRRSGGAEEEKQRAGKNA